MLAHAAELAEVRSARLAQDAALAAARAGIIKQRFEIEALKARLAKLLRATFGRSSEKLRDQVEQLELVLSDIDEMLAETASPGPADDTNPIPNRRGRRPATRSAAARRRHPCRPLRLSRVRWRAAAARRGRDRGPGLRARIVPCHPPRPPQAVLPDVRDDRASPGADLPVRRGRAGAGLLAHVLVAKYCDHLPLHRQAEIYAREDIDLSRSTLADMVGQIASLVRPLLNAVARHVMAGERVHADDTIVPVLEPGLGRTRKARLWTYARDGRAYGCTDPPAVLYRYSPDRQGEHPQEHLRGFTGILQADAYPGYVELYRGGKVIEAACMAHARRKFWGTCTRKPGRR